MNIETSRHDVIVVGAGIAGLIAASALAREGLGVTVLEARARVGGRAYSVSHATGVVELGATWFWPNEPLVSAVAEQIGVATFSQYLGGDALFEADPAGVRRLEGNPVDVPSARFLHGAQALAQALADSLPSGALRLGGPVSAVTATSGGIRVAWPSGSVLADDVILAVPPAIAVEQIAFTPALPAGVREVAAGTAGWMGGIVKAVALYDDAFWRVEGLAGSAVSYIGPFQEFHDHSGPDGDATAIFGFAPAARLSHCDSEELAEVFRAQLVRLFGAAAAEPTATHIVDWSRERFTAPRRPSPQASTATYGAPAFQHAVHGRIHWASTETATAYAGHLEGAVRAGAAAARRIEEARRARNR